MANSEKITKENTSWEDLLQHWEDCNNDRNSEQSRARFWEGRARFYEQEISRLERLVEAKKEALSHF